MNFDTHAAVKRLIAVGLQDRVAEEVVSSIAHSRDYDFSKLVTKDEFFNFKEEVSARFNAIDKEIALIKQEIKVLRKETKADNEALRKELKADIEVLRKEFKSDNEALRKELKADNQALRKDQETIYAKLSAEIAKSKNETLRWVIGLIIVQLTSIFAVCIAAFIKPF